MKDRKELLKLIAAFAAVYTIWGSTYLAMRFAIETLPPFIMAGFRFLTAGGILFTFANHKTPTKIEPEHWKWAFIVGGFLLVGGNGGVVWAEQFIPSGLAAVLIATVPIWVVIINRLSKKGEKLSSRTLTGVLLGFAGLVFLVNPFDIKGENINIAGAVAVMAASLSWALGTVYAKHAVVPKSRLHGVAIQMIAGGSLLIVVSIVSGELSKINLQAVSLKSFLAFTYLIFFGSIIAFTSYIWLIGAAGPARASTYAYVNPVVAIFLGWALAGEIIDLRIIIATGVIIFSVAVINSNFNFMKFFNRKKIPGNISG